MAVDFSFPPELVDLRLRVRDFMEKVVRPTEKAGDESGWGRQDWVRAIVDMRAAAKEAGLWLPHMPTEWGGMGLGHVAMAAVSAEAARTRMGPFAQPLRHPTRATCIRSCIGAQKSRRSSTSSHCARVSAWLPASQRDSVVFRHD